MSDKIVTRRAFLAGFAAIVGTAWPRHGDTQTPAQMPRIGVSVIGSAPSDLANAFREGMRGLGYVEGATVAIDVRYAEGRPERLTAIMDAFVRSQVAVIVAGGGTAAARAARAATPTIPIVTPAVGDAVGARLATSLARPGGNLTGLSMVNTEIVAKRVELLKTVAPRVSHVAVLWHSASDAMQLDHAAAALRAIGARASIVRVDGRDFDAAFAQIRRDGADAILVMAASMFNAHRTSLVERAAAARVPAVWEGREYAELGGLIAYGPNLPAMWRHAATYVDKILRGAKPADLPIEQATHFELVLNLKTARVLGLAIPPALLVRADRLIE